jgi:enoyl-CoA hydratase/carnithine racemase
LLPKKDLYGGDLKWFLNYDKSKRMFRYADAKQQLFTENGDLCKPVVAA